MSPMPTLSSAACKSMSLQWLEKIVPRNGRIEVFVKYSETSGAVCQTGHYDTHHLDRLVNDVLAHSGVAEAVFYRINAVSREAFSRSPNRLQAITKAKTSSTNDIVARTMLLIDVDPSRPAGSPATDHEKQEAWKLTSRILDDLREQGCPQPAVIDSGNGFQVLVRIQLPVDDDGLVKRVLRTLAKRFDNQHAAVDTTVADAARLARVPGTINGKGTATTERPHRLCRTISLPDDWAPATRDLLEKMAATPPSKTSAAGLTSGDRKNVIAKARKYIAKMPPAVSGQRGHDQTFKVACKLIVGFDLSLEDALLILREYSDRCEPPWSDEELQHKLEQADAAAKVAGQKRGRLCKNKVTLPSIYLGWEPLKGPEFIGSIPDFGHAGDSDVLKPIGEFKNVFWMAWPDYYAQWMLQFSHPFMSDVFLRQLYWGASYPRNWRRELKSWRYQELLESGPCSRDTCLHAALGNSHRHFPLFQTNAGWLDQTKNWQKSERQEWQDDGSSPTATESNVTDDLYPPNNYFYYPTYKKPFDTVFPQARKSGDVIPVYWPALLLGASKRVAWSATQQRLLVGIVRELTRDENKPRLAAVICGNRVAPAGKGTEMVTCPLLDPDQNYAVFGGNGPRRGRGYQLMGRTFRGWASRAGYRLKDEDNTALDYTIAWWFLHDLVRLTEDLDLVVVGYHPAHPVHKWRDLDALQSCLRTGAGFEWLTECCLRIFAPSDFLVRWRYFFSQRLGFRWIPNSFDDLGPIAQATNDDELRSSDDVRRWLHQVQQTQAWLAAVLAYMLERPVSRQRINRLLNGTRFDPELMPLINEIRRLLHEEPQLMSWL